jgi:hypothetical protein
MVNMNICTSKISNRERVFFRSTLRSTLRCALVSAIGAVNLAALSGCNRHVPSPAPPPEVSAPANNAAQATGLDAAALEAAKGEFEKTWLKRGDWWFAIRGAASSAPRAVGLRNVSGGVRNVSPLSDADRANGIEWQGMVVFEAQATRRGAVDGSGKSLLADWQEWIPLPGEGVAYVVTRRNGHWEFEKSDEYTKPPADAKYLQDESPTAAR